MMLPFGGSVEQLPEVPNRGSAYWVWNDFDQSHIFGDTEVRGTYLSPRTAISSGEAVPLFLVEGQFYDHQVLQVIPFDYSKEDPEAITGYTLSVNDFAGDLTIHMRTLMPVDLYRVNIGSEPEKLTTRADGQYLVFSVPNGSSIYCVERQEKDRWRLAVLIPAIAVEVLLFVILIRKIRKRKTKEIQK